MKVLIKYPKNARKWRKASVVIHGKDLWSGHETLSHIIHPFLVKYRSLYNEPNPMTGHPFGLELEQWITILDAMIYAFKWIKDDSTFGPYGKQINTELDALRSEYKKAQKQEREEQIGETFYTMDKSLDVYKPVFDKYRSSLEAHEQKIKEGLRLFGEHFQSLWT